MTATAHDAQIPCFLLLHGLGATGAVWHGVQKLVEARGLGRCLAPDLRGHGAAAWTATYSVGEMAADIAPAIAGESRLFVVGHSLGGFVALALASGWFDSRVQGVITIGTKIFWTQEERARAADLARRPAKVFPSHAEALERYRKVSGLEGELSADEAVLARGVIATEQGFRLAADPATLGIQVPSFAAALAAATCPTIVARGEQDALVTSTELRMIAPAAIDLPALGHNVPVQAPEVVLQLMQRCLASARA